MDSTTVAELRVLARRVGDSYHELLAAAHQANQAVAAYNAKLAQLAKEDPATAQLWPTYPVYGTVQAPRG